MKLSNHAISHFSEENVICPANLKKSVFAMVKVDNIDCNPSSKTATNSLHGTGISLFLQLSFELKDEKRKFNTKYNTTRNMQKLVLLPESYANVTQVTLPKNVPSLPDIYKEISNNS